jgi:hypothetical protein
MHAARSYVVAIAMAGLVACAPAIRPTEPGPLTSERMAQFWEDVTPGHRGDLYFGVGGRRLQPDPDAIYESVGKDTAGFSVSYDVRDPAGLEWSVKIGDEAQSEVAASRLVWAMGYRQPPVYYLPEWRVREKGRVLKEGGGRFRPKVSWLDAVDTWSWYQNPFASTQAYRGLLALMMFINSTDLKEDNNQVYERREENRPAARWYAVKDLGATFGATGILNPRRNDIEEFERHGFIDKTDEQGRVEFEYRGRHKALLKNLNVTDVQWMADRLARLSDEQWGEIFRAGGYRPELTRRFVAKLRAKIAEARALPARGESPGGSTR